MTIKFLFVIVDRGKAESVNQAVRAAGANYGHSLLASGTAKSDWLDILGLGSTERAVLTYTVRPDDLPQIYQILRVDFGFEQRGSGIAFTVPISAVGGPASLYILTGGKRR